VGLNVFLLIFSATQVHTLLHRVYCHNWIF